jgi:hypothetical protein
MSDKPAGWYYAGDGKLRYRDDDGWTEFYMEMSDPRARDWPPPTPQSLLRKLREEEVARSAAPGTRRRSWVAGFFYRGRHAR